MIVEMLDDAYNGDKPPKRGRSVYERPNYDGSVTGSDARRCETDYRKTRRFFRDAPYSQACEARQGERERERERERESGSRQETRTSRAGDASL